ncbi:uncharacterized protein G2W53_036776 [Senna tora]|uniref:Uncharacterized protein n=1 Tax=Senna tora TaxID=362788 RepID=A0A834W6E3_9FABA|nr:uncharacterized protein G2W53_036776 [Senna tora]
MAAASPAPINNNSNNAIVSAATPPSKPTTLATSANTGNRAGTPPKSQRGQNKPKCRQCGNVARSRCPYESCKSCCSRNQNPCHIHGVLTFQTLLSIDHIKYSLDPSGFQMNMPSRVLKANSNFSDKTPSSGAASLDQQSSETSQSTTVSRAASLRQLSNSFAQFNNLHISLRSRKPITRKDAAAINEWRLSKLKEFKERNLEVENEAFDRYMQNVDLLEEVFSMEDNVSSASESNNETTAENNNETTIPKLKLQLRSGSIRSDSLRMRIKQVVDEGLKKVQNSALDGHMNEPVDEEEPNQASKRARTERLSDISDLIDKINKARNEEDLKPCMEMRAQLFNLDKGSCKLEHTDNETAESDGAPAKEVDYSLPKLVGTAEIDQETINTIDKHFSSLEHVVEL